MPLNRGGLIVGKAGAGMGELAVVEVLNLTAFEAKLHPVLGIVNDRLQSVKGLCTTSVEHLTS